MAKVVQYGNIQSVVEAYADNDYPNFAVFQDRQLMFKFRGDDVAAGADYLEKRLTDWRTVDSGCVYTLCMFEDFPNTGVKYTSVPDASFNFRINDSAPGLAGISGATPSAMDYTALAVENAKLKIELAQYRESEEDGEMKEDGLMGAIGKIMEIPGVDGLIGAIAAKGAEFIQNLGTNKTVEGQARFVDEFGEPVKVRRVSGIPEMSMNENRLYVAVDQLADVLPDAADLLEKLVRMHKKDPFKFKFFVAGLRGMKY
jgi:hypothetical protein